MSSISSIGAVGALHTSFFMSVSCLINQANKIHNVVSKVFMPVEYDKNLFWLGVTTAIGNMGLYYSIMDGEEDKTIYKDLVGVILSGLVFSFLSDVPTLSGCAISTVSILAPWGFFLVKSILSTSNETNETNDHFIGNLRASLPREHAPSREH